MDVDLAQALAWWFVLATLEAKMKEPLEARIVIKPRPDGRRGLSVVDPRNGRENNTGLTATPGDDLDTKVRQLKQSLERAGNRVTVVGG